MSYLTGPEIVRRVQLGDGHLEIEPFDPQFAGPNSYDLHLGDEIFRYHNGMEGEGSTWGRLYKTSTAADGGVVSEYRHQRIYADFTVAMDSNFPPDLVEVERIAAGDGRGGWLLRPGVLYLGRTVERTKSVGLVPTIAGRSSLGRLGVFCHITAGMGDDSFNGTWTLELAVVEPVVLYPGGRYFQVTFSTLEGERSPYKGRYQGQLAPTASRIHHH